MINLESVFVVVYFRAIYPAHSICGLSPTAKVVECACFSGKPLVRLYQTITFVYIGLDISGEDYRSSLISLYMYVFIIGKCCGPFSQVG